jgi:hypothetical protein
MLAVAERLDLRDLSEYEIFAAQGSAGANVRDWRLRGAGPNYRHGGGIRYPIRWYLEWRETNRQGATAQRRYRRQKSVESYTDFVPAAEFLVPASCDGHKLMIY